MLELSRKPFTEKEAIKLLRSKPQLHYAIPELNDVLYACSLGWTSLDSVHIFRNLRTLYANSNSLQLKSMKAYNP